MKIEVIITHVNSDQVEDQLADIQHSLYIINERLTTMGAAQDELVALVGKIDTATTAIATRIQTLIDNAKNSGASVAELDAALQPEIDKLTAMGSDVNNPVPTVP